MQVPTHGCLSMLMASRPTSYGVAPSVCDCVEGLERNRGVCSDSFLCHAPALSIHNRGCKIFISFETCCQKITVSCNVDFEYSKNLSTINPKEASVETHVSCSVMSSPCRSEMPYDNALSSSSNPVTIEQAALTPSVIPNRPWKISSLKYHIHLLQSEHGANNTNGSKASNLHAQTSSTALGGRSARSAASSAGWARAGVAGCGWACSACGGEDCAVVRVRSVHAVAASA
jgi:hypothetical protein